MNTYLLQASLVLAVLTTGYALLLRQAPRFGLNRWLLWLNLVLAVSLPLIELPDFRPEPVRQLVDTRLPALPRLEAAPQLTPALPQPVPDLPGATMQVVSRPQSINWLMMLLGLYWVGVAASSLWLLVQVVLLTRLMGRSEQREENGFRWRHHADITAPFSFFGWIVLDESRYSPDELNCILLHESVHTGQWHSLDRIAAELLRIVLWFNPFAWWHGRLVQENLEYVVDREVLSAGVERKAYQYTLLKVGAGFERSWVANAFFAPDLKSRILLMSPDWKARRGWWRYVAMSLLLTMVIVACQTRREEKKESLSSDEVHRFFDEPRHLPEINSTRRLVNRFLRTKSFSNFQGFYREGGSYLQNYQSWQNTLLLKDGHLAFHKDFVRPISVFINGVKASPERVSDVPVNELDEFFVLMDWKRSNFVLLIQTQPAQLIAAREREDADLSRKRYLNFLAALSQTAKPMGNSYTYTMNELLEATFYKRKEPMVERLRNQHLRVIDEFRKDIDVYIDGTETTPGSIDTIHVRQVKRLYSRERPVDEWAGIRQNRDTFSRYVLYIETEPKRLKRDSSYYVFSPFYSGDF